MDKNNKEVKENYERNILPDPKQYYIKSYPDYNTSYVGYFYSVPVILPNIQIGLNMLKKQHLRKIFLEYTNVTYVMSSLILMMN